MTLDDDTSSLPALRMQVSILQRDFYKHSEAVNESLKRIFDFISEEIGARRMLAETTALQGARSELTWTKLMALAAVVGAVCDAPQIIHTFFH